MGCLNYKEKFDYVFGNIHLSGPCNRSCYFCIGQWMPGQDMNNNLGKEPLKGYGEFVEACKSRGVTEVNLTGSNTDPLLKQDLGSLVKRLKEDFEVVGIRTNGARIGLLEELLEEGAVDKISISVTSMDPALYIKTMGPGKPPELSRIVDVCKKLGVDLKVNMVLCPEVQELEFDQAMLAFYKAGVRRVNLREPYGQSRVGNPLEDSQEKGRIYGMPYYLYSLEPYHNRVDEMKVTYWDVHYCHVESVNLYADGTISHDYPISLGHSESLGEVHSQDKFRQGRQRLQWQR